MKKLLMYSIIIATIFFSGCIFGGSAKVNIYTTSDDGNSFQQLTVKKIKGKAFKYPKGAISSIVINPQNTSIYYAGTAEEGIYKTTDGGLSFVDVNNGLKSNNKMPSINIMAINPKNPDTIFAGGIIQDTGKLYRTTDGGENWKEALTESIDKKSITSIDIALSNPSRVIAGSAVGNIYASSDSGVSWQTIGFFNNKVVRVAFSPTDAQTIIIGCQFAGIFRSTNFGGVWQPVSLNIGFSKSKTSKNNSLSVGDIAFAPSNSSIVYAGTEEGLFISYNGGVDWQPINTLLPKKNPPKIIDVEVSYFNPNIIYFTIPSIIYRGENKDGSWISKQFSLNITTLDVTLDPKDSKKFYVNTSEEQQRQPLFNF